MKEEGYDYDHVLLLHNFGFLTTVAYQTLFIGSSTQQQKSDPEINEPTLFGLPGKFSSCFFYANDTVL